MHRSTLRSTLQGTAGLGLVEVLAVTVIVGIAVIGVALMFGKGSAFVSATGADRVAAGLAQQRIEQIRACGWEVATEDLPNLPNCPGPEPSAPFTRTVCIQYVDPATPKGLEGPVVEGTACPPGTPTSMVRITVTVSSSQPETSPVTLQAWLSQAGQ